jgi:O-antigen/teichoic acid export membrane protein
MHQASETAHCATVMEAPVSEGGRASSLAPTWRTRLCRWRDAAVLETVGTSFAIFGLNAIQGVLLARILGPQARGEYGTAVFYTQTLTYVGLLGTLFAIARRAAQHRDQLPELRRSALRVGGLTGVATMALVSLLSLVALPTDKQYLAPLGMAVSLLLPWEHMRLALLAVDHGSSAFSRYNANQLLVASVFPAVLLAVWLSGVQWTTLIVLLTIPVPILGLLARLGVERDRVLAGPASPPPTTLVREGFPYVFSVVAADLFGRLDVFLMLWLASLTVQGYYAAAVPAANLLLVAPNALALFAFNAGAGTERPASLGRLARIGGGVLAFQVLSAAAFGLVLEPLLVLVYGEAFRGTAPLAWALLPAYALNGCALVADGFLRGRGRAGIGVWSRLSGAAVMGLAVWLLFDAWRELSIPLAASAGHAMNALWIVLAIALDGKRPADVEPVDGGWVVEA